MAVCTRGVEVDFTTFIGALGNKPAAMGVS